MWTTDRILLGALLVSFGCASTERSRALMEAREMRQRVEQSRAPEIAPAHVREAEMVLARAEAEDPSSEEEKHLAYVAIAKFESALAEARRRDAKSREEIAHNRLFTEQARIRRESQAELNRMRTEYERTKSLLDSTQADLEAVQKKLEAEAQLDETAIEDLEAERRTLHEQVQMLEAKRMALEEALAERDVRLEKEREARMEAEQAALLALEKLHEIASIREEEQQTIITLTGSVLFASGESALLPSARERLNAVAEALNAQDESVSIVIEGHTDSQGSAGRNEELSYARAEAVRQYLIERGVDENRIRAVGRGEKEPIATNETPEGRAINRRVEIILDRRA